MVFWYDDGPWGGCRVPREWKIYYKAKDGSWQPVENTSAYGVKKGMENDVTFKPVSTTAVKLELVLPSDNASGIYEWSVQ